MTKENRGDELPVLNSKEERTKITHIRNGKHPYGGAPTHVVCIGPRGPRLKSQFSAARADEKFELPVRRYRTL